LEWADPSFACGARVRAAGRTADREADLDALAGEDARPAASDEAERRLAARAHVAHVHLIVHQQQAARRIDDAVADRVAAERALRLAACPAPRNPVGDVGTRIDGDVFEEGAAHAALPALRHLIDTC